MKHGVFVFCVLAVLSMPSFGAQSSPPHEAGWVSLFNGKNLDGWYTFLQKSGKNHDPERVFKVERGMIHVLDLPATYDGQDVFGYLATERELSHCRIRAEFKWGEKRFASRAEDKRDSGLIYYMVGPDDFLARSLQLQIQETDVGDLWINGGAQVATSIESENPPTYGPGWALRRQNSGRIVKASDAEDRGGWNTVEVVLDGDRSTHLVNGRVVMRTWNLRQPDPKDPSKRVPLDRGRLLLEAEGAEIWFRKIEMKPLPRAAPRPQPIAGETGPLSLDSSLGRLLGEPHSRALFEVLLNTDALANPLLEQVSHMPARDLVPALLPLEPEQLQALDRALLTLPVNR